jgi:hypothetical protein
MDPELSSARLAVDDNELMSRDRGAYFPLRYFADFLAFIAEHEAIEVLTYANLPWGEDWGTNNRFDEEWSNWQRMLAEKQMNPDKIHVLIQHDVDSRPERTMKLLQIEERLGIASNIMVFNKRIDRRHMRNTGMVRFTDYDLDIPLMQRLERKGWVVGYHSNAYERAQYDQAIAQDILARDIEALSGHFKIRFLTAHGGTPGPDGLNNKSLPLPEAISHSVRWVHNGRSPIFTGHYSDGGINSAKRDPSGRDLRDFVRSWRRGGRYRLLTHPQYYDDPVGKPSPRLDGTPWYDEIRRVYAGPNPHNVWKDLTIDLAPVSLVDRLRRQLY